ncbi:MAG TPA: hypothetical protein VGE97_07345 [Nitrososphaera sp.]|jgi:hypothetical protein
MGFLKLLIQVPLALFTLYLFFRFMYYLAQVGNARVASKYLDLEREKLQAKKPVIYVTNGNGNGSKHDEN